MTTRRLAGIAAAALLAGCSLDNQTVGVRAAPTGGAMFANVANIGTSLSAGFQSGGINDSTQRQGPMYQLAVGMGLTPGVDWVYPSFAGFGCPAPYTNSLTGARQGGTAATYCGLRTQPSPTFVSDVAIPGLRAAQAIDLTVTPTSADTLKLAQFITGSVNPVNAVLKLHPSFVTIEVGANDVLAGATRGDTTFLTSAAAFTTQVGAIRDSLVTLGAGLAGAAIATVPNVTVIPFFTKASTIWCLNTGLCPSVPATLPYSSPGMSIALSCAPAGVPGGGQGDSVLLTLNTTGAVTSVLAGGGAARINCTNVDSATVKPNGAPAFVPAGAVVNTAEYAVITARVAAFNTSIANVANAQGWALVDVNAALAANAAQIPPLPNLASPGTICAPLFSLDCVHPTKAGYRILAVAFQNAINAKYSTSIAVP